MLDLKRHAQLLSALIGPHMEHWHTSAEFRATVMLLAQLLPRMIDQLAEEAKALKADRAELLHRLEHDHPGAPPYGSESSA